MTTTNDTELTAEDLDRFRIMKEGAVADMDDRGTDDLDGLVEVWRDGEPIVFIVTPIDRDKALDAAHFAVRGFRADRIIVSLDSHYTTQANNPSTGKPWGPGEMQKACDEDGACSLGIITDALVINTVTKDSLTMYTLPYHVDKDAKQVHWQRNEDTDSEGATLEGLVPDVLRAAFQGRPLIDEFIEDTGIDPIGMEPDPKKRQIAEDAAIIFRLAAEGYGVMFANSDAEWIEGVQGALAQNPFADMLGMEVVDANN